MFLILKTIKSQIIIKNILFIVIIIFIQYCAPSSPKEGTQSGSNNYGWVKIDSVVPSDGFNSNTQNYFTVNTEASIDVNIYPYNSWLVVQIWQGTYLIAESGYLLIPPNPSAVPQLNAIEFGGGWLVDETGDYKLIAKVFNLVADPPQSTSSSSWNNFTIEKFNEDNLTTYTVEYDQCDLQMVYGKADLGYRGEEVINQAFVQAGVKFNFSGIDGTIFGCNIISIDFPDAAFDFVNTNRNQGRNIYLAGVIGFHRSEGNPPWGIHVEGERAALIAYSDINDYAATNPFGTDSDDCDNWTCLTRQAILQGIITHEFGHIFSLGDDGDHSSIWCVMYNGTVGRGPFDNPPGRYLMSNPHFCDTHLDSISLEG